jgi:aryl-alcohol dehydrogenase-like predicted oxidoreductase
MEYKLLGATGLRVSVVGMGAWQLGSLDVASAHRLLDMSYDAGVTLIDTAAGYGESEDHIGAWDAAKKQRSVIATKAHAPQGCAPADIIASIDRSLMRLRVETIDLLQLHSPGIETASRPEVYGALEQARQAGKICFACISEDAPTAQACLEAQPYAVLQTDYSMVTLYPERSLLAYAQARGVGVIAREVFGRFIYDREPWYGWEEPMKARSDQMQMLAWFARHAAYSRAELTLRFVLANPLVQCSLLGTANPEHLAENLAIAERGALPADLLSDFRAWVAAHPADGL